MGNRLTKIYTRKGDDGNTSLATGERVGKDCLLIKAQGDLDELNSNIACVRAFEVSQQVEAILIAIQHHLFNIGGELSAPQCALTKNNDIEWLEQWIDFFNESLPPLEEFILPGGDAAVAHCHVARTVCRRAERNLVEWSHDNGLRAQLIQYINRLSDLLFVLARVIEENKNCTPTYWNKDFPLPKPNN
ncbi:MAG: cob(I)yrinic acid a,c-diamide adenosyltransferase [Gammaproteobacteria bacterium]|nr:cob(I)yrinic acid a,c-diamide adenosyltransferase [Gammaproteobacteria bacterium]